MKQFSFEPLKYKIIAAFAGGCFVLVFAYLMADWVFNETFDTLETIAKPNPKLALIERLYPEINRLDKTQRAEALHSPLQSMKGFNYNSKKLQSMLDSLQELCAGDTAKANRIKQMQGLLLERNRIFLNYLRLYNKLIRNNIISRDFRKLTDDLSKTLKSDTGTIKTTRKSVTTTSLVELPEKKLGQKRQSFFRRLFSKKSEAETEGKIQPEKIITRNVEVTIDTYHVAKKNDFKDQLDQAISSIEIKQRLKGSKFLQQERKLAITNSLFIDKLQTLLQDVQKEEIAELQSSNRSLELVFNSAFYKTGLIIFIFFLFTLILIVLMFSDIANSRRYKVQLILEREKAQRLEQVKQRFLANVSHELRSPLQTILGFSELLQKQKVPEKKSLEAIHSSSEYLLQLVNEVLDYHRIVSDKFTISKTEFDMYALLADIADVIETQCEKKGLRFRFDCRIEITQKLFGDAFRLKQILYNLLVNAVKFTQVGEVSFSISSPGPVNGNQVFNFEVRDTGIGMTETESARIFESFEQANSEVQKKYGGSGLGLSIVKELVEQQGGSVSVESKINVGSGFKVTLSFEQVRSDLDETSQQIAPGKPRYHNHVLVIDDDAFVLQLCASVFQQEGIRYTCINPLDRPELPEIDPGVDIVFMDIRMPGLDIQPFFQRMKQSVTPQVIFVAITAYAFTDEKENILRMGFDHILLKPFRSEDLLSFVTKKDTENETDPTEKPDLNTIMLMSDRDPELFNRTCDVFSEQILMDLDSLETGLAESNLEKISQACHRLSSKTGQIGLDLLSRKLLITERFIRKKSICNMSHADYKNLRQFIMNALANIKTVDLN